MNKYEFDAFPTFIDDLHVELCNPVIRFLRIRLHPVIFVILLSVLCHSTLGSLHLYTLL